MLMRNDLTPFIHYLLAVNLKFSEPDATSVKKTWYLPKCCLLTIEHENISQKAWPKGLHNNITLYPSLPTKTLHFLFKWLFKKITF